MSGGEHIPSTPTGPTPIPVPIHQSHAGSTSPSETSGPFQSVPVLDRTEPRKIRYAPRKDLVPPETLLPSLGVSADDLERFRQGRQAILWSVSIRLWPFQYRLEMELRKPATIPVQELGRVASAYRLARRLSAAGCDTTDLSENKTDPANFWMCSSLNPIKTKPFSTTK